jgi:uncharacterized phage protein gp47/JayE
MSFRRKTYPEIADNLLNRVLGGVSGEAHAFPPPGASKPPYAHPLEQAPASDIISVFGLLNGESHAFVKGADYELSADGQSLKWKPDAALPDAGSVVEVNYQPKAREVGVNDLYVGSVLRTLMEAMALETAGLYAQMDQVYQSGFIDTAQGRALDHVVSLLGLARIQAGRNSTDIQFKRARNSRGEIYLPAGTRVLNEDGSIEYETLADAVLVDGQDTLKVKARDLVDTNEGVNADTLVLLAKPIAGIESVSNPGPSSQLDRDENDDELRTRAKSFLAGSERGTLGALKSVLAAHNVRGDIDDESEPGVIKIRLLGSALSPDQEQRLWTELNEVRPAGVRIQPGAGVAAAVVDLSLRLSTATGLLDTDLRRIQAEIKQRLSDYFDKLPTEDKARTSKLIGLVTTVQGVEDIAVVAVKVDGAAATISAAGDIDVQGKPTQMGALNIVDPALATQLALTVRYARKLADGTTDTPIPEQAKLEGAVQAAITYLNKANQSDAVDAASLQMRHLSFGKLGLVLPLPGRTSSTLDAFDATVKAGGAPALPTVAALSPYSVQWLVTRPNGVSQVLDADTAVFDLDAFERLSLGNVAVQVKPKEA